MIRKFLFTLFYISTAIILAGCAATGGAPRISGPGTRLVPPDRVAEPFHFNITDRSAKKWFATLPAASLPSSGKLELTILKELAEINSPDKLTGIVDTLWNNDPLFKKLVGSTEIKPEHAHAAALVYYLMISGPRPAWQEKTADSMYENIGRDIKPELLSGYALHFYTYALLKTGKFESCRPFLKRLSQFTDLPVYQQDLVTAFSLAAQSESNDFAAATLKTIYINSLNEKKFAHDEEIMRTLVYLKQVGAIGPILKNVLPLVPDHPGLQKYRSINYLEKLAKAQSAEKMAVRRRKTVSKTGWVNIKIEVIEAQNNTDTIDPALEEIAGKLKKTFPYTGFKLLGTSSHTLLKGEKARMQIAGNYNLTVIPERITHHKARIRAVITKDKKPVYQTVIESVNHGESFIGGPNQAGKRILLRIMTVLK